MGSELQPQEQETLSREVPPLLPAGFLFGVSDSGYQSEGGYNSPGEPANNWASWERNGRVTPAGVGNQFWNRYPEHFDRAAEAGCNSYRLSVEWARCEPAPGVIDDGAIDHYRRILASCIEHNLEPIVALHHFTHPEWLGTDFWLRTDAPKHFSRWVAKIVPYLAPYCQRWTTINEINALAIGTYLIGYFPPGRLLRPDLMMRMVDHLLCAHALAYEAIHRVQPSATVGTSTYAFWVYDVDRLLVDVLAARSMGISRNDVTDWLDERRRAFHTTVLEPLPAHYRRWQQTINAGMHCFLRRWRSLPSTLDAIYSSDHERCLDVTQVNYYDPNLSNYLCRPGRRTAGRRHWGPDPKHWEQTPGPEHLQRYLAAHRLDGVPIWIMENGLCNAVIDGVAHPRDDGWDRPSYLAHHLAALADALEAGIDVRAYFYWTLFDNYQWGEFESCFGLAGVTRDNTSGDCKFLELDSMGNDSIAAYRRLTAALRRGDRSELPKRPGQKDPGARGSEIPAHA
ncbi:MAG: family 1 glycosylhydrolase [Acidimicrobiales bacterium]|nr:family 1 glycosylhydrolase [Acidimicrobiales bacterium]